MIFNQNLIKVHVNTEKGLLFYGKNKEIENNYRNEK